MFSYLMWLWFGHLDLRTAFCTVKDHCDTFALVSPPIISSTVSLCLFPSPRPLPSFVRDSPFLLTLSPCFLPPSAFLSFSPPLPPSVKSAGHQSYVVSGSPEVHSLLHLAQLPLADPQGPGPDTAAAHAGPLPLLNPRLPGQEDTGGLMCW